MSRSCSIWSEKFADSIQYCVVTFVLHFRICKAISHTFFHCRRNLSTFQFHSSSSNNSSCNKQQNAAAGSSSPEAYATTNIFSNLDATNAYAVSSVSWIQTLRSLSKWLVLGCVNSSTLHEEARAQDHATYCRAFFYHGPLLYICVWQHCTNAFIVHSRLLHKLRFPGCYVSFRPLPQIGNSLYTFSSSRHRRLWCRYSGGPNLMDRK